MIIYLRSDDAYDAFTISSQPELNGDFRLNKKNLYHVVHLVHNVDEVF